MKNIFPKQRIRLGSGHVVDVRRGQSEKPGRPVMLLIHGIGISGTYFIPFAEICAPHYNVRIIDMPGYGQTPKPKHALSPREMADVAAEYLDVAGIKQAIIVGQSMGCQTATQLAMRHPGLCAKLILIGPVVYNRERSILVQGLRLIQDSVFESLAVNLIVLHDYVHMGVSRYLQTARHMVNDHIEEHLRATTMPVLITRGSSDKIVPRRWIQQLANNTPGARLTEVPGAAHLVNFTKPRELFAACEPFLKT